MSKKTIEYVVKVNDRVMIATDDKKIAIDYAEEVGGKVYKVVTTVAEYEMIGDGVWA